MSEDIREGLMDKGYSPKDVERKWYGFWEKEGLFSARDESDDQPFSIVIPPPNVTGVLHMGHALNNTLQDILCRYRRLMGDNVLWMPGTDHAGIATQNVVEKKLASEGKTRHELGREKFIEEVWKWKEQSGSAIIGQLKHLGASCDWSRERFTMDDGLSKAVRKVFVKLYEDGLIYKGKYIINWCPRCHTALADLEVEHEEKEGSLYHIIYPFDGAEGGLTVATTRPETMFGDTAVAVNPEDPRFQNLPSEKVRLPLTGRVIPVIRDSYVNTEFGTGALKVTPAHDPNDFEIASRHNIEYIKVIADDGTMLEGAGKFKGLDRYKCRAEAVEALRESGLLVKEDPHVHAVGHCYRCKTVIEPNLSTQWFVRVKPLADKAIAAVEMGKTRIIPSSWSKTYFEWMYNIRDWCISRQIWWGHQIPAWNCADCNEITVATEEPSACKACGSKNIKQDDDVLDTWFSSALWPFSTMGWPDKTKLLETFYPTSVLVTGFDILFFWVARMMMMGLYFMDEVPFRDVYVHALVRDEYGQKMSKSKGNVIDPLGIIDVYGADAFRYTLAIFAAMGRDIKLAENRIEGYRHFINKIWNASRFAMMHLDRDYPEFDMKQLSLPDKWMLSRLYNTSATVSTALDEYRFNDAASILYKFVWNEFCDWYVEAIKPVLFGKKGEEKMAATKAVLLRVMKDMLIMLHPFIPFVTEEIWHRLPGTEGSIMKAHYPTVNYSAQRIPYIPEAEVSMEAVIGVISGIRNIRGEMNINPSAELEAIVQTDNPFTMDTLVSNQDLVINLARLKSITLDKPGERPKAAATAIAGDVSVFVPLEGVIDFAKEAERLEKEMGKAAKEMETLSKKLDNPEFTSKAPEKVIKKVKDEHDMAREKYSKLHANLDKIKEFSR